MANKNNYLVNVGSLSLHKVNAVMEAFNALAPNDITIIKSFKSNSGVAEQPFGMEETLRGAYNRASQLPKLDNDKSFNIGIEGGLVKIGSQSLHDTWICLAVVCLITSDGKTYFSTSSGMQFPEEDVKEAHINNTTVGHVLADKYGGDHTNPRHILSKGRTSRQESLESAVKLALYNVL